MIVFKNELKQNYKTLLIWSVVVGGLILIFMMMYRSLQGDIESMSETYANMGGFSAAFGMDKISFTTAMGFYGVEAGAMLSICGAMFAGLAGISALSKEEHNHTAEFLLTHPIKRESVVGQKLLAAAVQVLVFNLICMGAAFAAFAMLDEKVETKELLLFHLAQFVMHLQIACICFFLSSIFKRQTTGIGLGLAAVLYFLSVIYNVSENAGSLKYVTPFVYADAGSILSEKAIDMGLMGLGIAVSAACAGFALFWYRRKDIAS